METDDTKAGEVEGTGDALETIDDPETLREIAQKRGAGYTRVKGEREELKVKLEATVKELEELKKRTDPSKTYITQEDLFKQNEKRVKEKLTLSEDEKDKEIAQNFDDVFKFYQPVNGRDTEEGIMKDLRSARAAWREQNPPKDTSAEDATRELQGTVQQGHTGKAGVQETSEKFKTPVGPESWYPKKDE